MARVRLLNYVAEAPLDCPVAVVFGHAAALNWVTPHFADLGLEVAEELWKAGYPADVIPSSEIALGALQVDGNQVRYAKQRYRALVFLNPEFEPESTTRFLRQAAASGTHTFLRGGTVDGVMGFQGAGQVVAFLKGFYKAHDDPATLRRLTDGSCLLVSGAQNPEGDPMRERFYCGRWPVEFEATGVFSIRLTREGKLDRLAASGLKRLVVNGVDYQIAAPADVALWHNGQGKAEGVVQGSEAPAGPLGAMVQSWQKLNPAP
jgi:hypothetical protein